MKLISLNTWGGRGGNEALLDFFRAHADTDIFCLQEIWEGGEEMAGKIAGSSHLIGMSHTLLSDLGEILHDHTGYFRPHFNGYYGLALFIKKSIAVKEEGELFVYKQQGYISSKEPGDHARNIQYVTFDTEQGTRTVINFHGLWNGLGKRDSEDRLLQSANIASFVKNIPHPYVLCGDFNLEPDTESLKLLEKEELRNLITEYGITSTRTSLYKKPVRFADYALVSKGIAVHDFKVLPEEVSDHAALYLDFE